MNKEQLIIENYFLPLADNRESLQLKNDAAFLQDKNLVISTDMMIEDQHFTKKHNPEFLAKKLLRINLSDLAAMGADPFGFLLNVAIPNSDYDKWLKFFVRGLKNDMKKYKLKLFGGDMSCSKKVFLSVTILGRTKKYSHLKNFTKSNSDIYVTGNIGDAGLGLKVNRKIPLFNCSKVCKQRLINKHLMPSPRLNIGRLLLNKVEFCTDISDGLIEELLIISKRSKKQVNIFLESIPISPETKEVLYKNKQKKVWETILFGGEDYELLFSLKPNKNLKRYKEKITKIGYFSDGSGVRIYDKDGNQFFTKKKGFSHF